MHERRLVIMTSVPRMPWGKHQGPPLREISSSYLAWVLDDCDHVAPWLADAITAELHARFGQAVDPTVVQGHAETARKQPVLALSEADSGCPALRGVHHQHGRVRHRDASLDVYAVRGELAGGRAVTTRLFLDSFETVTAGSRSCVRCRPHPCVVRGRRLASGSRWDRSSRAP
jgi:hypothetical protein